MSRSHFFVLPNAGPEGDDIGVRHSPLDAVGMDRHGLPDVLN